MKQDWLAWNRDNVSEWGDRFIRRLLFQWAITIKIQLIGFSLTFYWTGELLFWTEESNWVPKAQIIFFCGINLSPHSDTLSRFQANQSLLFLLNAECLAEKQQIPILYSLVWPNQGSNQRSTALKTRSLTITPPILCLQKEGKN
jgi:hypothetical protein